MKVPMLIFLACLVSPGLAGRAFPTESVNYAVNLFREITPEMQWDPTNFTVDLSGYHARCKYAKVEGGPNSIETETTVTRKGNLITVVRDSGPGRETHVNAVNSYIKEVLKDWPQRYETLIRESDVFGCSVRPGCQGRISVACLFAQEFKLQPVRTTPGTGGLEKTTPSKQPPIGPSVRPPVETWGRAFTPEQYILAEKITGKKWDRSHWLENISGFDIKCGTMLAHKGVTFKKAYQRAKQEEKSVRGEYGVAENQGTTQKAMLAIVKKLNRPPSAIQVGCSLIPDCVQGSRMYVVVNCMFMV